MENTSNSTNRTKANFNFLQLLAGAAQIEVLC